MKPIPMAGFTLTATVTKPGRNVATSRIELRDLDDVLIAVSLMLTLPLEPAARHSHDRS